MKPARAELENEECKGGREEKDAERKRVRSEIRWNLAQQAKTMAAEATKATEDMHRKEAEKRRTNRKTAEGEGDAATRHRRLQRDGKIFRHVAHDSFFLPRLLGVVFGCSRGGRRPHTTVTALDWTAISK